MLRENTPNRQNTPGADSISNSLRALSLSQQFRKSQTRNINTSYVDEVNMTEEDLSISQHGGVD